jgi:outer membrane protein TolC
MSSLRIFIFVFCISVVFNIQAQQPNVMRENAAPTYGMAVKPTNFEDYLVQLAIQNSAEVEAGRYDIEGRNQEILLAKKDWTRNLTGGLNLNDVSLPFFYRYTLGQRTFAGRPIDTTRFANIVTYPLWSLNLNVNIGDFVIRKSKVRLAESKKKMSEMEQLAKKQKLRGEVLKRYTDYLSTFEILKVRLQALDVADAARAQINSLFSVNKVKIEEYNEANRAYFDALENKVKGEVDVKIKKVGLEELIGVRWEQVERVKTSYDEQQKK